MILRVLKSSQNLVFFVLKSKQRVKRFCLFVCFVFEAILGFYKKKKAFDLVEDTNEATWFTIYVKKIPYVVAQSGLGFRGV